jgi:energy-coupling factor transport system ATP-binding protein
MISVESLSFRYPNAEQDALRSISLECVEGTSTAIMGANGSGKSTLARCLNGLLLPTAGRVLVDGLSTADASALPTIRRRVGLVFQDPHAQMTSPSVERELAFGLQNIGMAKEEIHRRVDEELQRLGFARRRADPPSTLSGGEKQRLALASVMVLPTKYLVLDEPTSFLSPSSRRQLMQELFHLHHDRNVTLILITPYLAEALNTDRVIVLHNGMIAFDGTPHALAAQRNAMRSWGIRVPRDLQNMI